MSGRQRFAVCCACAALAVVSLPAAGQGPVRPAEQLPRFRRIFIPADEVDSRRWRERYLAVDADEFEGLLETVYDGIRGAPDGKRPRIETAVYQARVVEGDLLVGSATLQLTSAPETPTLLEFEPCSLAVESPRWPDAADRPAVLGAGRDGQRKLLVEGPRLRFDWSQRGQRTASGSVAFDVQLPHCPMTRLALDLPAGQEIVADRGIVTRHAAAAPSDNHWSIELGGHDRLNLRVVRAASRRRPLTLLRQSLSYEFSPSGVNVSAQLRLDVHGEPLERAVIDLDRSLRLVGVKYGKQAVPWSATSDAATGTQQVVLEFPEPVAGTGRVLQLSAVAPLDLGRRVQLPGLRPRDMAWQEGTVELVIRDALVLEQLETRGCRQSRVTALPAPLAGESIEIQFYEPAATIALLVAEPSELLPVRAGTLVEIGSDEITSRCGLDVDLQPSGRRRVPIAIHPAWTIDTVERAGGEGSVEWEVDEPPEGPALLTITADGPNQFIVGGRRARPTAATIEARQLQMLDLASFDATTNLISVRAGDGWEAHWQNAAALDRREAATLDAADVQLFAQPPAGLVFAQDEDFAQSRLTIARRKPSYTVDVHIDVAVRDGSVHETYSIHCEPDAARVERLLVRFSLAREQRLEWSLAGANSGRFSARRLTAAEQEKAGMPPGGEVWELLLRLERPGTFELRGQRELPFAAETPLSLASVDDATAQQGTLAIRAWGETGLEITNRRLVSVPGELLEADRYQTVRATYHYQPADVDFDLQPAVSITPAPAKQAETGAWAWLSRLTSRFAVDDTCVHQATLLIETAGRTHLTVGLPGESKLLAAWLDQERLTTGTSSEEPIRVDLPSGRRRAALTLYYSTPTALPALVARQAPPMPTIDEVPVLLREWIVWLPPGFEIVAAADAPVDGQPAPSWSERLFGPLGRGTSGHVFNPLVTADWRETFADSSRTQRVYQDAQRAIRNLGAYLGREEQNDDELTWGQLLAAVSDSEARFGRVLLVDSARVAEWGLTPHTQVGSVRAADLPLERGSRLLSRANLVMIATPTVTLITAAAESASYRDQLRTSRPGLIYTTLRGPLADQLHAAAQSAAGSRHHGVARWRNAHTGETSPWGNLLRAAPVASDHPGWARYSLRFAPASEPFVRVVRTDAMRSLCWAVFLGLVALGLWRQLVQPWMLVAVVGAAGVLALVISPAYAPLASAAVLAGLFGCAARAVRRQPDGSAQQHPARRWQRSRGSTSRYVTTSLLAGALVYAAAGWHTADAQPPSKQTTGGDTGHRVYVPVDEDRQPVGDKFYVPDELYADLLRRAASASGRPADWLVTRASFQGDLARDGLTSRLELTRITARFDLHVFQPNLSVELPLERGSWGPVIAAARLDGVALPLSWDATGTALMLDGPDSGRHRLELDLDPAKLSDARSAIDLPIPELPQATLELTLPQDMPDVEVPHAKGRVTLDKPRRRLVANLGSAGRLAARWSTTGADAASAANLEVEELIWLRVRPGTAVLDARFTFRVLSGRVRQLSLLTDPRLSLLAGPDPRIAAVHTIPGDLRRPQRVELELAADATDEVTLDLSFLVVGASGVGNLPLPQLESEGARAARRWLGVSVDPALHPRIQAGEDSQALDVGEFVAAWGATTQQPRAAFTVSRGRPVWVLSTQPSEPRSTVEQTLALSLGARLVRMRYEAAIEIEGGSLVQLVLAAPRGTAVERVSVLEDNVERVARWSVRESPPDDDTGGSRISVFLNAPIDGSQQLSLVGRWSAESPAEFSAPRLHMLSADVRRDELHVYRQPAVLATLQAGPGTRPLEPPEMGLQERFGVMAGRYALDNQDATVEVALAPNNPQLQAVAVTYLERDSGRWMARLHLHVNAVTDGLADSIRFEIPPQWSGPFRIDPPMPHQVVAIAGDQRRELVLQPDTPLAKQQEIRIRGRIAPLPGDRLSVPDVLPLGASELERFVVLPGKLDGQQITWDMRGLSPAQLPTEVVTRRPDANRETAYQVAGEHFQASLKAVQRDAATARIELLDIHVVWQPDGSYHALAAFDLQPGGTTHCVLDLPGGCRLVNASVAQLPALVTELGPARWRLGLGPARLPQRIEVIYTYPGDGARPPQSIPAPRLVGIEIGHVLWTVYTASPSRSQTAPSVSLVAPTEQQLKRLQSVAKLVELPTEVVTDHLPEEIARWYDVWRQRYAAGRADLRAELVAAGRELPASREPIVAERLDERIAAIDERLGAPQSDAARSRPQTVSSQIALLTQAKLPALHAASDTTPHDLELRPPPTASESSLPRLFFAVVLTLAAATAAWWVRRRGLPTFAPWVVATAIGFVWWLALTPSGLGLLLIAVACCTALWTQWQSFRHGQLQ